MALEPKTLKGFRDFLPKEMRKRNYVLNTLKEVFESYGFEPLETPILEYEEILTGKYGDEDDKLMYKFTDNGGRKVAMRYDQTVPLARVVAQYTNDLPLPFKRYQIQNVYRAENTQKGRYREILQVDVDTIGPSSLVADKEIISLVIKCFEKLGFKNIKFLINDRSVFGDLDKKALTSLDKLDKIGEESVKKELKENGYSENLINEIKNMKPTPAVEETLKLGDLIKFSPTLVRGLDYYTGLIFEVKDDKYTAGSLGGGGRYDNLIGIFSNQSVPAVGFAFGFGRLIEAMEELNLFPDELNGVDLLVTNTNEKSLKIAEDIRSKGLKVELYVDEKDLDKQLRYADKKQISYVLITGEKLELKNMKTGERKEVTLDQLPDEI